MLGVRASGLALISFSTVLTERDAAISAARGSTRDSPAQIRHGTPEFHRTNLALFSAGFATFALMYCVQPLMPVFASDFRVSAASSSLSLSLTTGLLAPTMLVAGAVSEARGRKSIMAASLLASALLTLVSAFIRRWDLFLLTRALAGLTFAGLPAVSMAYLSEEMHPGSIGLAMGLFIGGNGLGGMVGRIVTAVIADAFSWRYALGAMGILGVVASIIFWRTLPPSRHFKPQPLRTRARLASLFSQLRDPRLVPMYAEGFLLMGAFVTSYNYITYHLLEPPFALSHAAVGFIFIVYLVGIFASAWIGARAERVGRRRMLTRMLAVMLVGAALTLVPSVALIVLGIATVTFGFFGGHSVASSWVGLRATHSRAQAAALYLFFYYMGASFAGPVGGVVWEHARWPGVIGFVAVMLAAAVAIARFGIQRDAPGVR